MVKIALQIKAMLENVTNLHPEGDDFRWYIKVCCSNCREVTGQFQYLTLDDSVPLKGGRGSASMVIKCHLCSRENSLDIIRDSISCYNIEDVGKFKTLVMFDCRGAEPVEFSPRIGFVAEGVENETTFSEIDLSENDWCDYDEKAGEPVRIYEIECQFMRV